MLNKTLKYSRQREAIMNILNNTKTHPSAEWIYHELKKEFPNVSLATVYRNLNLLLDTGKIIRLDVGSGTEHYDADCSLHYHFLCKNCGSIIDVNLPCLEAIEKTAEELNKVSVDSHSLIFYGMCRKCKKATTAFNKN